MSKELKYPFFIFLISFILNLIWENIHFLLYAHYQGGEITRLILARASFFDALLTVLFVTPFLYVSFLKKHSWLIVIFGIALAIGIEWNALQTGRWAYNELMPIIPFTPFGLTPVAQLGILGYITYRFSFSLRTL